MANSIEAVEELLAYARECSLMHMASSGMSPTKVIELAEEIRDGVAARTMLLPLDAEGRPIRVGDAMEWPDGQVADVIGVGDDVFFYLEDGQAEWSSAYDKTHEEPDSWEIIIADATALGASMGRRTTQIDDLVERCRKLAGDAAC
jgi:hypothetical protein